MNVCILFTNSYKHKYTCIRIYKHNTEKISSETDRILKPCLTFCYKRTLLTKTNTENKQFLQHMKRQKQTIIKLTQTAPINKVISRLLSCISKTTRREKLHKEVSKTQLWRKSVTYNKQVLLNLIDHSLFILFLLLFSNCL